MKHLTNTRSFFKLLLPILFICILHPAFAQPELCKDPCPPGPEQWMTIPLCQFHWSGQMSDGVNSWTDSFDAPFVFVMIGYRIRTCNGVSSVIIEDNVYVDNRDYWINDAFPGLTLTPSMASTIAGSGCMYPPGSMQDGVVAAGQKLLDSLNLPQTYLEVTFRGACYSFVKLRFPKGAFWTAPNDLGGIDTAFFSPHSNIGQRIPCSDACCKVKYKLKIITLENGQTESTWVATSYEGDSLGCLKQPLPDYKRYKNKLTATVYDPNTGTTHTVTGTVAGQEPCKLTCPEYCLAHSDFRASIFTGLTTNETPLEFSAIPTLVSSFVRFKSSEPIQKVVVYDMSGKIVLSVDRPEIDEINTSELRNGVYFLQAYFPDNDIKTVKILKQ